MALNVLEKSLHDMYEPWFSYCALSRSETTSFPGSCLGTRLVRKHPVGSTNLNLRSLLCFGLETDEPISLREFMKPTIYRPFIISIMMMLFQQFSGINAVVTYASQMLRDAGISNANVAEITIAIVQVVGTGISCLIVDKLGRRKLLMFPTALMCISMAVLGASRYFDGFPSGITLLSLCCFIVGFSLGMGPIPWLLMSEIFPTKVRGVASGIATQVNWLGVFIIIKFYVNMENAMHPYGLYWFYAAVCLISVIYVFIFLPETKGKTLEEVEELFATHHDLHGTDSLGYGGIDS